MEGPSPNDIDQARKKIALAERVLDGEGVSPEPLAHHTKDTLEVGADPIHLVDQRNPRDCISIRLAPYSLGLGLHAAHATEHGHGSVKDTKRALDLRSEVNVPGSVDHVDPILRATAPPVTGRSCRRDCDAALLLLLHPVHVGGTLMHFTHPVEASRVVEDALSRSGLAGINVRHDANIPQLL